MNSSRMRTGRSNSRLLLVPGRCLLLVLARESAPGPGGLPLVPGRQCLLLSGVVGVSQHVMGQTPSPCEQNDRHV